MSPSPEAIRNTVESYIKFVGSGTADEILSLFAEGATVEDPVGTGVKATREAIREFYGPLEGLEQVGTMLTARIAAGQAAFHFELATKAGDQTYTLAPIDVMTFDDDGKITSMRAFWADTDLAVT